MKPRFEFIRQALDDRKASHRLRTAHRHLDDGLRVNVCSNDYLGLKSHPVVKESARAALERFGAGSGASRLVSGTLLLHEQLEQGMAAFADRPSALLFNSGFQMNTSVLPALANRDSILYFDKLNHNSLYQGALLSRATLRRYRHNDVRHLETLLKNDAESSARKIIVTESVFSMDGDLADIDALIDLADKHGAILMVDEAHSIGLMGPQGRGMCFGKPGVDIVVGTFGKAFGSFGAFVACEPDIREYLVNFSAGFIYSTSLPPAVLGASLGALNLMTSLNTERSHVFAMAHALRNGLTSLGYPTRNSESAIVPAVIGSDEDAMKVAEKLHQAGFLAQAIRPPTVEEGTARIRFTVSAIHTQEQIDALIEQMARP